ncbi:aldehyde dehydrogenase family protein [Frankia tisae]|uniref:aldehyde dehydrogenase family protein n=1 Tax=Frankia tisae TaxID=2950104 RepID=UPI0021C0C98D|nr:aldehyde dehydrogenase family protein [Frankia tisae]
MSDSAHRMLIDGQLVAARDNREFDNINPATEEVIGTAPEASASDVERAIAAARRAFDTTGWSTDADLRIASIGQLQAALRKQVDTLRPTLTAESGMPLAMAFMMGVDPAIEAMSYYPDLLPFLELTEELPPKEIFGTPVRRVVRREAAGVVAAITPWNVPFELNLRKSIAALAAGCTVVLKPAPETPWSATLIAAAAAETDLPPGVLNIVTTSDNSVAEILTRHPDVDQVAFTGSTATGRLIMANGAPTVKRVSLELGGKSALIVLDEQSLQAGVLTAAGTICVHSGQGCTHYTRLLVPAHLIGAATELAKGAMEATPYGDPLDPNHMMGPLISQRQLDRVLGYMDLGRAEGRLVTGGGRATQFDRGYFVQPTVFTDVPNSARIAREEIFGPVLSIIAFDGDDDAVAIANDSTFGLSGAVFSADTARATGVAQRLRTGTVSVNGAPWFDVDSPFGGYKQSGLGREFGREGLEDFMEIKTVSFPA